MKRCMYCGHENDDSVVTCAVCGNRLSDIPDGQTSRKIGFTEDFSEEDAAAGQQADSFESTQKPEEPAAETREAFAGQRPVDDQFSGETPAGQFPEEENAGSEDSFEEMNYAQQADPEEAFAGQPEGTVSGQMQGGQQYYDGTDWRQDVGRGQTYAARQQYEAKAGNHRSVTSTAARAMDTGSHRGWTRRGRAADRITADARAPAAARCSWSAPASV